GRLDLSGAQIQELVLDGRLFDDPERQEPAGDPRQRRREQRRELHRRLLTGRQEPAGEEPRLKLDRSRLSKLSIRHRIPDSLSADGVSFDDLELPHRAARGGDPAPAPPAPPAPPRPAATRSRRGEGGGAGGGGGGGEEG